MEQRDYILREIEKIGLLLRAVRQKLMGGKENLSLSIDLQSQVLKGELLTETNFDLDRFLNLEEEASIEYIDHFKELNVANIELLADCLSLLGPNEKTTDSEKYLKKAVQLYEHCQLKERSYSLEREAKLLNIKRLLSNGR